MLAKRNLNFWTAALLASGSYLLLTAKYVFEAVHRFEIPDLSFGFTAASILSVVGPLAGAIGWWVVATAIGAEIDWRRLRRAAAMITGAYVTIYAAWVFEVVELNGQGGPIRAFFVWSSIGAFLLAAGAAAVLSGLGDSKRGAARGRRLQIGLVLASASVGAVAVAGFELHAFQEAPGFWQGARTGNLVAAIGQIGVALAVLLFALESRWPLPRRERMLARAAAGASLATICVTVGGVFVAVGFSAHDTPQRVAVTAWLAAASSLALGIGLAFVALGARAAVRTSGTRGLGAPQ